MIKRISLLTRKPGMTHAAFVKEWRDVHAPLAVGIPGLYRYVQSHIQSEPAHATVQTTDVQVDGVAELWFEDEAAMAQADASPEAQRLFAHGAEFIAGVKSFLVHEEIVIPAPGDKS